MELIFLIKLNISESYIEDEVSFQNRISLLNIMAYIISLIGFMIYLEIIELNFCKLNYNLRKYINDRGIKDSEIIINDKDRLLRNSSMMDNIELDFKEEKE